MQTPNLKTNDTNQYDAIVIGTGISGGIAAMELCRKGLKTLVLERGRHIAHGDYPTASLDTWDFENQGKIPKDVIEEDYHVLKRKGHLVNEAEVHHFVKDSEHPYTEEKRFDWIRGYQTGGRSLVWGRQCYEWSDLDFEANAKEGIAVDWPIRQADIKPWYDYVTKFIGISGRKEGLKHLPDGPFQPPMELNCAEAQFRDRVQEHIPGRTVTEGRVAHVTAYDPALNLGSRGNCQYRDRCRRGCPYGGYYSSNSGPLVVAEETGNMTLVNHAAVREIIYDADTKRATGVRVKMTETNEEVAFFTKGVVFLCASSLNSASILLASKSDAQANGLGNDSDMVGRNIMDHHHYVGASGSFEGLDDKYYKGRKANGFYVPRFVNLGPSSKKDYLRGFGYQGGAQRGDWRNLVKELSVGPGLKKALAAPGGWSMGMTGFGECLPDPDNRVTLNETKLDKDGLPTLSMNASFGANERAMRVDMKHHAAEMLEAAGAKNVSPFEREVFPGYGIHEMGTARMGRDPRTSVLNKHNQVWNCLNLYVTDGSAMTSASCVNPSLTYMALTARAVDHAVGELNRG
ncbi:GMC oxidoreductase [Neolewinella antarctica]|uniref:Choline dehydrogenase-like flavoprotein n=1 Tax=Neolewinella antarctica TaxID=442734 RepID=A0ABX0XFI6_9BACT|nr:GMC family oxidoreductase [Neolewinella antarctica]NJC27967.1 choline dehydrogenase-like flavoprotein [Neolewinella antarctica]